MSSLSPARRSILVGIGAGAALLGAIAWVSSIGGTHGPQAGLISVLYALVHAGPPALAFVLGSIGLGAMFCRLTRNSRDPVAIEAALGLAFMLSMCQVLAWLGLLSGQSGLIIIWLLLLVGMALLARRVMRSASHAEIAVPWQLLLAIPALAVLLTAASNAPGWLWTGTGADPVGEARGYDALSYHLQLPQEWLALGKAQAFAHNVYSFLPGYVETAFYSLGIMLGAPTKPTETSHAIGLLAGDGYGVISCQLLHAGLAIFATFLIGRLVKLLIGESEHRVAAGALAAVLFLSTPWTVITGSLAYNEMGMLALSIAAAIAAFDEGIPKFRRGVLSGFLLGVACGCKPTALFLCGPIVGAALIFKPGRIAAIGAAALGGAVAVAPWLIRNWIYARNPVFPMATSIFGSAFWEHDRVQRYVAGHSFTGTIADRFLVLLSSDRGILHSQWAVLPFVAMVAAGVALFRRRTHIHAAALVIAAIGQVAAWMLFTHLQSRFLMPLAITGCSLFGLALARSSREAPERPQVKMLISGIGSLICVAAAGMTIGIFSKQSGGLPNALLLESPWIWTGELDRAILKRDPSRANEVAAAAAPSVFVNLFLPPNKAVYLLGSATPLYYTCPVIYNTTWDRWTLGMAMRRAPGQPSKWTEAVYAEGGRFVLVDEAEIDRLQKSGWADPSVTRESIAAWLKDEGRLIRSWPQTGTALYELRPPSLPPESR